MAVPPLAAAANQARAFTRAVSLGLDVAVAGAGARPPIATSVAPASRLAAIMSSQAAL